MLRSIRDFFETHFGKSPTSEGDKHRIAVATAALVLEVARVDRGVSAEERASVLTALQGKFGVTPEEAARLAELAEAQASQATDYYQFTSLINTSFTPEQKERVIEMLWQVAYIDARLDAYEEHFIRKIADLLYVPHAVYIAAKLRVRDAAT